MPTMSEFEAVEGVAWAPRTPDVAVDAAEEHAAATSIRAVAPTIENSLVVGRICFS
jgi:hypothetical protein